jgi:hypothetical protein
VLRRYPLVLNFFNTSLPAIYFDAQHQSFNIRHRRYRPGASDNDIRHNSF